MAVDAFVLEWTEKRISALRMSTSTLWWWRFHPHFVELVHFHVRQSASTCIQIFTCFHTEEASFRKFSMGHNWSNSWLCNENTQCSLLNFCVSWSFYSRTYLLCLCKATSCSLWSSHLQHVINNLLGASRARNSSMMSRRKMMMRMKKRRHLGNVDRGLGVWSS